MEIEKQRKNIFKAKSKLTKPKSKPKKQRKNISTSKKPKPKKHIKTFDEYFEECIKNKTIPADTPPYLKRLSNALLKEYKQGIKKEKSALDNFAEKYTIDGEPGVTPIDYFVNKLTQDFFLEINTILKPVLC